MQDEIIIFVRCIQFYCYSACSGGSIEGPWTVKLNYNIAEHFLEYCPDRDMRWLVWTAEDKAASVTEENRELNNSLNLEEIRYLR